MTKDDGGPAFPSGLKFSDDYNASTGEPGMTLRDWFAGQALAGMLLLCRGDTVQPGQFPQHIARNAYEIADAMLKARKGDDR